MNEKMVKGSLSNFIARLFICLHIMLIIGSLYGGVSQRQGLYSPFFRERLIYYIGCIFFGNVLGIGALVLSLIVWLYHKNLKGKATAIASAIVIIVYSVVIINSW